MLSRNDASRFASAFRRFVGSVKLARTPSRIGNGYWIMPLDAGGGSVAAGAAPVVDRPRFDRSPLGVARQMAWADTRAEEPSKEGRKATLDGFMQHMHKYAP